MTTVIVTPLVDRALRAQVDAVAAQAAWKTAWRSWMRVPPWEKGLVLDHPLLAPERALQRRRAMEGAEETIRASRGRLDVLCGRMTAAECRMFRRSLPRAS